MDKKLVEVTKKESCILRAILLSEMVDILGVLGEKTTLELVEIYNKLCLSKQEEITLNNVKALLDEVNDTIK